MTIEIHKSFFSKENVDEFINLSKNDNIRTEGMKDSKIVYWKFISNPNGPSNYFYFKKNEKIKGRIMSAHYPGKIVLNENLYNSFCLSDLYIDKSYRQLSNLKNLYNECVKQTQGIIFHSSNENSEKFYTKILKKKIFFNLISCGLPMSIKPLKKYKFFGKLFYYIFIKLYIAHIKLIKNLFKIFNNQINLNVSEKINFDYDLENLREENIKKDYCFFFKNHNFFKWRYEIYKKSYLIKIFDNNNFLGYCTLVKTDALKLSNMIILDFQFRKKISFFQKIMLKFKIIEICTKNKVDTLFTMGNENNFMFKNILGYPFFKIPSNILPHSNPMFIHNASEKDLDKLKYVNFTISDFDYF